MNKILNSIAQSNSLVNVIIQVQSYGRVFIYDQLGIVVSQEEAICVSDTDKSIEERIEAGLETFYEKMKVSELIK